MTDTAFHRFVFSNFRYSLTLFSKFFSSFPHGTCSLSVGQEYLALEDGPPMFRQGFTCPALLNSSCMPFHVPGYHRLRPAFPGRSARTCTTFGLIPVRSSLLGESRLISFPRGTEIFQFSRFALRTYVFSTQYPCGWVSPFGHRRINACCQLPDAFRRLPRPSSPLTAKASTVCA